MPIYEYRCRTCQKVHEVMQSFSDPPLEKCEACGGGPMEKLISLSGFALKGSGFYTTDYKRSSSKEKSDGVSCDGSGACGSGPCSN